MEGTKEEEEEEQEDEDDKGKKCDRWVKLMACKRISKKKKGKEKDGTWKRQKDEEIYKEDVTGKEDRDELNSSKERKENKNKKTKKRKTKVKRQKET